MSVARARGERRTTDAKKQDDGSLGAAIDVVQRLADDERAPLARQVSTDWSAEREADAVADAATPGFSGPALDGDRLSAGLQDAMRAASPALAGLGEVKFDQSDSASSAADSIDALAFTKGSDVSVSRGEMTPHLAAHEATHAVQHAGDGMVHAKLRGTKTALESMGGPPADKIFTTNWEKILEGVGAYEGLEESVLKDGNPSTQQLQATKPVMLKTLTKVEGSIKSWQKANDSKKAKEKSEERHKKTKETSEQAESDDRTKAGRRQAIAMLQPRIGNEINLLKSKDSAGWLSSLGLSSSKVTQQGQEKSGQKNPTKELKYQTENGEFSGYFKAEKGFSKGMEMHEIDTGIRQVDPNYGARAVAMYKIDQILGAGVTARAEFATHVDKSGKTVMGTVLEAAKGSSGGDTKFTMNQAEAKQTGGVSLDDPKLQSGLNKLQILDAICGQLDRHAGNYFVETDPQGNVIGVTGIDLDMAFGEDMLTPDSREAAIAHNYKGMPEYVDAEFGRAILKIAPGTIQDALTGLLSPAEVNAAVRRFIWVRKKIEEMIGSERMVEQWGPETLGLGSGIKKSSDTQFQSTSKTYGDVLKGNAFIGLQARAKELVVETIATGYGPRPFSAAAYREIEDWPKEALEMLATVFGSNAGPAVGIAEAAFNGQVTDQLEPLAMTVLNELLRDPLVAQFMVFMQENGVRAAEAGGWNTKFKQAATGYAQAAVLKLQKTGKK